MTDTFTLTLLPEELAVCRLPPGRARPGLGVEGAAAKRYPHG